jgi:cysteine desulfurase
MIYLDHAATTPLDFGVLKKMLPWLTVKFGNASSIYSIGREARNAVEKARAEIAGILGCKAKEIIFTSGGTEANNWAVFGIAAANKKKGRHIITVKTEHHSVLHPFEQLEARGFKVTYLNVDKDGLISTEELKKSITAETIFVSIMYANNEIGTVQNLPEISGILRPQKIIFHTDACQAAGYLPLNVKKLGVDSMTINGGKIYGPKGIGALYISEKVKITPLLFGGGQEFRMRGGTENTASIIGLAESLKKAESLKAKETARLIKLRDFIINELLKISGVSLNGHRALRLANNINISLEGVDGESLLMRLDMAGICASSGSACTSGSLDPSHVLQAIGLPKNLVKNSLRLSLGRENTPAQLKKTISQITKIVKDIRLKAN